jgi:exonuclease SbcD
MRLLHTSDWHLGRSFHREDLLHAQRAFLDHLVAAAEAHAVDAVLVAGDVFDRAIPSLGAVELYDRVLRRLSERSIPTVLISGNHDSAGRLGMAGSLLRQAGIHLRTAVRELAEPVLLAGGAVALYGVPYLEPALVREELGADSASHTAVLGAALDRVRADLAARGPGVRSVVLAHAFVTGGEIGDSERDISVGGVPTAPASVFDGIDYAALGHLHSPQELAGGRVRYSGSPLAYSFSEAGKEKSVTLVDLDEAGGAVVTRPLPCPVPRAVARLRGRLEELLDAPEHDPRTDDWLQITLTDPVRPRRAMERLRARFPHTLQLLFEPDAAPGAALAVGRDYASRVRGRSDAEIAEGFVQHVRGDQPTAFERELLASAVDEGRLGG